MAGNYCEKPVAKINPADLSWKAGDTETLVLLYTDPQGVVVNLTDTEAFMQLRVRGTSATFDLELKADIDGPAGSLQFTALPVDTRSLLGSKRKATYVYDVELTFDPATNLIVKTLVSGKITVTTDVTRLVP